MSDQETLDVHEHQDEKLRGIARAALKVLNPHVYYSPIGNYGNEIIRSGVWITVELAERSFGWDETEKIPEVKALLERMNVVMQIAREEDL